MVPISWCMLNLGFIFSAAASLEEDTEPSCERCPVGQCDRTEFGSCKFWDVDHGYHCKLADCNHVPTYSSSFSFCWVYQEQPYYSIQDAKFPCQQEKDHEPKVSQDASEHRMPHLGNLTLLHMVVLAGVILGCLLVLLICVPVRFTHATGTTGRDTLDRHNFCRDSGRTTCVQCGGPAADSSHYVAAHVSAYPCFPVNNCLGYLTLQHTCSKCNNHHYPNGISFCRCVPCALCTLKRLSWCYCQLSGLQQDFGNDSSSTSSSA